MALSDSHLTPPQPGAHNEPVTAVIRHRVKPDAHQEYEALLAKTNLKTKASPGYVSTNIVRPPKGEHEYTIILHFKTVTQLQDWLNSDARRTYIEAAEPLLAAQEAVDIHTGMEFWFTPEGSPARHAKPYKQFLVTLSALYPTSLAVQWLLAQVFDNVAFLNISPLRLLITLSVTVALMVFVIMPRYTRLVSKWLFR